MHKYKDLIIWNKSRELVKLVYDMTISFPSEEKFGLTNQMRRAAVSIPSNIAEGAGRGTDKDFCRFLDMAQGSAFELETQIYLCIDQNYVEEHAGMNLIEHIEELQKMTPALQKKLNL